MYKKLLLLVLVISLVGTSLYAQRFKKHQKNRYGVQGYDTVAYFTKNTAIKGEKQFSYKGKISTWIFSSKKNKDLFAKNPEKYMPQYAGHCASAMARGSLSPIDPKAFTVYKNKLYLNCNLKVRKDWNKAKDKYIGNADKNWIKYKNRRRTPK